MGNAAITINHPTSLDHGIPYLDSGKIVNTTTSMIRLEKRDGTAVGCGGRVRFKKIVKDSEWTYKITSSVTTQFGIGYETSVTAGDEDEATAKVAVELGITATEARENVTLVRSVVSDKNRYSEIYAYVDYAGKNVGQFRWTKNDLGLKASHRWAEDSEMILDINF